MQPEGVYVTADVRDFPGALERAEAMIAALQPQSVQWVTLDELDQVAATGRWAQPGRWGENDRGPDPDIVLTTAKFLTPAQQQAMKRRYPHLGVQDMYGFYTFWRRNHGDADYAREKKGVVCQSAWELHTVQGCPFRCSYCGMNQVIRILVNVEQILERLDDCFCRAPAQRLYKWDNHSDIPCFEPEYGASRLLVERFARETDRYLEIYVGKSADTDYLLDYDHKGQTILQWSVAGESQIEHFETGTDGMIDRFEAAARAQEAGYLVRFRLSPIIPVRDWREENLRLLEEMFERTLPDVVTLCPFGWMDVEEAEGCLDFSLLDPEYVQAMRAAAPFLRERGYTHGAGRPIPHDARYTMLSFLIDQIEQLAPGTVIALCLETDAMWHELGARIGQDPGHYVCNCGGACTPGGKLYDDLVGAGRSAGPESDDPGPE
jgi:hypothetical protein